MKKKLIIYILAIIAMTLLIYSIIWFIIITSVTNKINKLYANHPISAVQLWDNEEGYFVQFKKLVSSGFPFKIACQVIGWHEEGESNIVEFHSPIYIGYDLLKQHCFISYSGQATGRYKPLGLGFGAKFVTDNYSFIVKLPLSLKLFKIFTEGKDPFEIVNFLKKLELQSNDTKIFDLVDGRKLYDEDHSRISITWDQHKYYTGIEDFKKNIPQKLNINYSTKILASNILNRRIPVGILLYRPAWSMAFSFNGDFHIKTNKSLYSEFTHDFEIKIISGKFVSNTQEYLVNLLYQSKLDLDNNDNHLKIESKINLKPGFSEDVLNAIQYSLTQIPTSLTEHSLIKELQYFNDNKDKFNLALLENHQYVFNLDMNYLTRAKNIMRAQINDLSIFSNNTGVRLSSECKLDSLKTFNIKGLAIFNNYSKLLDIITDYLFNLGQFKTFSEDSKIVYKDGIKYFLKTISDHPDSISDDISFKYELDSANITKGKIGNIEINKILPLYYLALYKKASEKIRIGDNIIDKMQELVPDFSKHKQLLEQLRIQPFNGVKNNE